MSAKAFIDTNVLIYALDIDSAAKHDVAKRILQELWNERTGALSTQLLQEFYVKCDSKNCVTTGQKICESCSEQLCHLVCRHDSGRAFYSIPDRG